MYLEEESNNMPLENKINFAPEVNLVITSPPIKVSNLGVK